MSHRLTVQFLHQLANLELVLKFLHLNFLNCPEYKKQLEIYGKTNNFTNEYNKAKKQAKKEGKNNEQAELFALKKAIKKLILDGRVEWDEIRIK